MNSNVSWFRFQIVLLAIVCLLLACWSAAAGNTCAGGATRVTRLGRQFKLRAGQQVTLKGQSLRIKFAAVKEDSRCPADVTCVWAGNAAVLLEVSIRGRGSKSLTLNTNSRSSLVDENPYRGYRVKLVELNPYPRSSQRIAAGDYIVTLLVSKN